MEDGVACVCVCVCVCLCMRVCVCECVCGHPTSPLELLQGHLVRLSRGSVQEASLSPAAGLAATAGNEGGECTAGTAVTVWVGGVGSGRRV